MTAEEAENAPSDFWEQAGKKYGPESIRRCRSETVN
jgi:hypothetical protein